MLGTVSGRRKDGNSEEYAHDSCWPWLVLPSVALLVMMAILSTHFSSFPKESAISVCRLGSTAVTNKPQWLIQQALFVHLPSLSGRLTAGLPQVPFTLGVGRQSGRLATGLVSWQREPRT